MRVLVTRPAAQAASWVEALRRHGVDAVALPLIGIAPPTDTDAVARAWLDLAKHSLVVFVSPNAADEFFALRPASALWPASTRAASVGPGTTQTLLDQGVPPASIVEPDRQAMQFDSEALWQRLSSDDWAGRSVLIVRGDGGREWLSDTLRDQGAKVTFVAAYRRIFPSFEGASQGILQDAVARPREHVWFFSSSEAIANLAQAQPNADWRDARAIATHPRIAQRARDCGFGAVSQCPPTLDGVVACIQSAAS
jgi:uroporphyrinogen-III synthase